MNKKNTNYRERKVSVALKTYHMLLHGALMPNNLRCTTDSEHQCEHTQSFLASEGAISNLHAGEWNKQDQISGDWNVGMLEHQTNWDFGCQKKYCWQYVCIWLSFSLACHVPNNKHNAQKQVNLWKYLFVKKLSWVCSIEGKFNLDVQVYLSSNLID